MSEMDRRQFLQGLGAALAGAILRAKAASAAPLQPELDGSTTFVEIANGEMRAIKPPEEIEHQWTAAVKVDPDLYAYDLSVLAMPVDWDRAVPAEDKSGWELTIWTNRAFAVGEVIPIDLQHEDYRFTGSARVDALGYDIRLGIDLVRFSGLGELTICIEC